jgi:hypothetical protein
MKTQIFLFLSITILFSSCSSTKINTAKSIDIYGAGVIQKPVIVDLVVKETKVTGFATGNGLETVKSMAIANAINKANIDILVEPKFEITTAGDKTTVTVNGFPGTYKNFRPMVEEDLKLAEMGYTTVVKTGEASKESAKKPKWKLIGGVTLGATVALVLLSLIGG